MPAVCAAGRDTAHGGIAGSDRTRLFLWIEPNRNHEQIECAAGDSQDEDTIRDDEIAGHAHALQPHAGDRLHPERGAPIMRARLLPQCNVPGTLHRGQGLRPTRIIPIRLFRLRY